MGTHVKGLTQIVTLPVIAISTTYDVDIADLVPTSIIVKSDTASGTLKTQVSPDGTTYYDVESISTTTTKTLFYLTASKYYGYRKFRLSNGSTGGSGIVTGGHLILCEV